MFIFLFLILGDLHKLQRDYFPDMENPKQQLNNNFEHDKQEDNDCSEHNIHDEWILANIVDDSIDAEVQQEENH